MTKEMIQIKNLQKHFGNLHVLKGVNLTIAEQEVLVIIGPSGCGKSTLLRCMTVSYTHLTLPTMAVV